MVKTIVPLVMGFASVSLASDYHFIPYDTAHLEAQQQKLTEQVLQPIDLQEHAYLKSCPDFVNKTFPWNQAIGDEKFGADLKTEAFVRFNCEHATAGAWAKLKGTVFEKDLELASAELIGLASNEDVSVRMGVFVLGYEVDQMEVAGKGSLNLSDSRNFNIDRTFNYSTSIGPIPIRVDYGMEGKAVFGWQGTVGLFSSEIKSNPRVDSRAFVYGGISAAEIASMEVGGSITLMNDQFQARAGVALANGGGQPEIEVSANITNKMHALDGKITGKVEMMNRTVYEREFFAWHGINQEWDIINLRERVYPPKGIRFD